MLQDSKKEKRRRVFTFSVDQFNSDILFIPNASELNYSESDCCPISAGVYTFPWQRLLAQASAKALQSWISSGNKVVLDVTGKQ